MIVVELCFNVYILEIHYIYANIYSELNVFLTGGKSQRVARPSLTASQTATTSNSVGAAIERRSVGRPRKNARKACSTNVSAQPQSTAAAVAISRKPTGGLCKKRRFGPDGGPLPALLPKPLSHQQRCFVLEHRCFLVRNLEKIRKTKQPVGHTNNQVRSRYFIFTFQITIYSY